jgi:hypothetical protein
MISHVTAIYKISWRLALWSGDIEQAKAYLSLERLGRGTVAVTS